MPVRGMVEKPKPEVAPSNMAVIGRYILSPNVLRNLEDVEAGAGGEIQLTDAIAREIAARGDVNAFRFKGRRFDCGSKPGYLQATVAFGLARPDLRDEFLEFLRTVTESEFRPREGRRTGPRRRFRRLLGLAVGQDRIERRRVEGRAQLGADRLAAQRPRHPRQRLQVVRARPPPARRARRPDPPAAGRSTRSPPASPAARRAR